MNPLFFSSGAACLWGSAPILPGRDNHCEGEGDRNRSGIRGNGVPLHWEPVTRHIPYHLNSGSSKWWCVAALGAVWRRPLYCITASHVHGTDSTTLDSHFLVFPLGERWYRVPDGNTSSAEVSKRNRNDTKRCREIPLLPSSPRIYKWPFTTQLYTWKEKGNSIIIESSNYVVYFGEKTRA